MSRARKSPGRRPSRLQTSPSSGQRALHEPAVTSEGPRLGDPRSDHIKSGLRKTQAVEEAPSLPGRPTRALSPRAVTGVPALRRLAAPAPARL